MNWTDAAINVSKKGIVGKCPECGSLDTDFTYVITNSDKGNGFLDMWCNDCHKRGHMTYRGIIVKDKSMSPHEYEHFRKQHNIVELREAL
ncbi:hypothetical protein AGMMS49975_26330 [Clostridia bacterium]|nr:hypothetical protein AGMMS49975_26330 [Clostridia bacterium]